MKMKIQMQKEATMTTAKLLSSYMHINNGHEIVVLQTSEGNFSNFKDVWERQGVDIETVEEGQEV